LSLKFLLSEILSVQLREETKHYELLQTAKNFHQDLGSEVHKARDFVAMEKQKGQLK